jgi:hypothetical protein
MLSLLIFLPLLVLSSCGSNDPSTATTTTLPKGQYLYGHLHNKAGSSDNNPCVENVIEAVNNLHSRGEPLGFNWGAEYPKVLGCGTSSHWQGVQRLPLMGRENSYIVVSSSHKYGTFLGKLFARLSKVFAIKREPAFFGVVKMESRGAVAGRLRSNRLRAGELTRHVPPARSDSIVKAVMISPEFTHPGGMQVLGKYLMVSADGHIARARKTSLFTLWNMADPQAPKNLWQDPSWELPGGTAGSIGLTKLATGNYLMLRALKDAKALEFYMLGPDLDVNPATYHDGIPWAKWHYSQLRSELKREDGSLDLEWGDLTVLVGTAGYQNTNIVTECGSGNLYLIASHGRLPSGFGGEDIIDVYRLDLYSQSPTRANEVIITKVASRRLDPVANAGARQGDLQAASGVYISPDNQIYFYATEHGATGKGGFITMAEFAPRTSRAQVESIDESWVELYDKEQYAGRLISLDFVDRKLRDYNRLVNIERFDNRASSAIYAIAKGCTLRLYSQVEQGGEFIDLVGSGEVERIADFSALYLNSQNLKSRKTADNQISSLEWRGREMLNYQR